MYMGIAIAPLVALIAGILILFMPRLLNYIVAVYLIVIGLAGLAGSGILILGFAVFGELILRYLHVSLGSLSIAGGLLLMLVALEMLRGADFPGADGGAPEDVALVPLATPLVAGPGAIATSIVLWRAHPSVGGHAAVLLAIVVVIACVGVALLVAERITRATSPSVLAFLTRVFGLLLSAIAVQLVVDGVRSLT
jgi:multiple antibiotic resistance protein